MNCLFPLQRLKELDAAGEIGRSAARHYSIMGYILRPEQLLQRPRRSSSATCSEDQVDVVVLVPA